MYACVWIQTPERITYLTDLVTKKNKSELFFSCVCFQFNSWILKYSKNKNNCYVQIERKLDFIYGIYNFVCEWIQFMYAICEAGSGI